MIGSTLIIRCKHTLISMFVYIFTYVNINIFTYLRMLHYSICRYQNKEHGNWCINYFTRSIYRFSQSSRFCYVSTYTSTDAICYSIQQLYSIFIAAARLIHMSDVSYILYCSCTCLIVYIILQLHMSDVSYILYCSCICLMYRIYYIAAAHV